MRAAASLMLLLAAPALAAPAAASPKPPPTDAECVGLPPLKTPFAFGPGESLEFDLDAMGAQAGKMTMKVLPQRNGTLPVEVRAQTNTFFSKVRRVTGLALSYLSPKTLRPTRYTEDATENGILKTADVTFNPKAHNVALKYATGGAGGDTELRTGSDTLDVGGAIYAIRQLPLKKDLSVCFDVYGIRTIWRMSGKVIAREHVSLPIGEFEAWHLSGEAVRLTNPAQRREVHVWISDDERRLPLAALGAIDLGAVRATLTGFSRPGDRKARSQGSSTLKW